MPLFSLKRAASLALVLGLASPLRAQDGMTQGRELLALLSQPERQKALAGEGKSSIYIGRSRQGSVVTKTSFEADLWIFEDEFSLVIEGLGQAVLKSKQVFRSGQLHEAELLSRAPDGAGRLVDRVMKVQRDGSELIWTKTCNGESRSERFPANEILVLVSPPVGVSMRLLCVLGEGQRASLPAIDMETGSRTRLRISVEPLAKHDFRARSIDAREFESFEGAAQIRGLISQDGRLLSQAISESLSIVAGLTDEERFRALPELETSLKESPEKAALHVLRLLAKGLEDPLRAAIDFDSLYAEASKGRRTGGAEERAAFEAIFMERVLSFDWARDCQITLNTSAMSLENFKARSEGDRSRVSITGGGELILKKNDSGEWRLCWIQFKK